MPKLVDHVSYRKHLLEQCIDLFAQYGYGALTMRQIAEALHVSTGTLYHYFPTKEALFRDLVEEVTQNIVFEATTLVQQHATLEERLTALFEFIARREDILRKQFLISLNYYQHRDLSGEAVGAILKEGARRYRRAIITLLELRDPQLCTLLLSQVNGLFIHRMINGSSLSFAELARPYITMLVDYLRKEAGSEHTDPEPVRDSELSEES